jgi:hypothetical protein
MLRSSSVVPWPNMDCVECRLHSREDALLAGRTAIRFAVHGPRKALNDQES